MEIRRRIKTIKPETPFEISLEQELLSAWYELATMLNNGLLPKAKIGQGDNYLEIDANGAILFTGASGLSFGEIYLHDNSTATTVPTGATYTKIDQWGSNGQSNNMTPAAASDKITVTKTGKYLVTLSASFASDTANVNVLGSIFLNGVEQDHLHFRRKIATANDEGAVSISGIIDVTAVNLDVDLRVRHDGLGDVDITLTYANLTLTQIGGT